MSASGRKFSLISLALVVSLIAGSYSTAAAQGDNTAPTGQISAELAPPYTFYSAEMTDAEDQDTLAYIWGHYVSCGVFTGAQPAQSMAEWDHGPDTNCSHESTSHPGLIYVNVFDPVNHVRCVYEGSLDGDGPACAPVTEDTPKCSDGIDNDEDELIDGMDSDCTGPEGDETPVEPPTFRHVRRISIRFNDGTGSRRNGLVVFGRLRAPGFPDCRSGQPVNVQRRINGRWITKKSTRTNRRGRYAVEIFDQASRYRALALRSEIPAADGNELNVCQEALKAKRYRNRR